MSGHLCLKWNNHSTAFIKSISSIQIKERYCDATIVCQGKYFPVHRVVLSTCSDYFDEMFERMQCQHPYIVFKDIDPKEMELLLNYMYQGEVNVVQENLPMLIKAAEALKVKGLAVPDDLPSKESSGRKRGSTSNDMPMPKRRSEEKRRRRDSSDQMHAGISNSPSQNRDKLDDSTETIESKLIKEEPLDTGYTDPPLSTDYGQAAYSGSDPITSNTNQTNSSNEPEDHFVTFPVTEETKSFVKQEQLEAVPSETFSDEQSSAWSDFASGDILEDLPPETSVQDDVSALSELSLGKRCSLDNRSKDESTSVCPLVSVMPREEREPSTLASRSEDRNSSLRSTASASPKSSRGGHRCPYCAYRSITPYNVRRHIRFRHTGERPYQCWICGKSFSTESNMKVHMRLHTGDKPFKCTFCSKTFTQMAHLNGHKLIHLK